MVEHTHGTDVDEAADVMVAAGVEDVAGAVDGAGAEGFGRAFHGGADVVDGLDTFDGTEDVGGVTEVADDGIQVGHGRLAGQRSTEKQAGSLAFGQEAGDQPGSQKAAGTGDEDFGGGRGLGSFGFERVFIGVGGDTGGGDPADGIAAFGGSDGVGGAIGETLVEGAHGGVDTGRGFNAAGGKAQEGGGGADETPEAGADAIDDGVELFGARVGAVDGAALEEAIDVDGAAGAVEPHFVLNGLHIPTEHDVAGSAAGGLGGGAPFVVGEEGITTGGAVEDVEGLDGAEKGFDEVEGVNAEVAKGV